MGWGKGRRVTVLGKSNKHKPTQHACTTPTMAEFLLLGQDEFRKTLGVVNVYCPHCRSVQSCKEKELGLHLSCFWIPFQRVALLAKYYKCQNCKNRFPQYAPDWEQMDDRVAFEFLLLTCLIHTRMANGAFRKQPEASAVRQQFLIFAHTMVDEEAVIERAVYMKKVSKNGIAEDIIPLVLEKIHSEQREHILRAMTHVAIKEANVNPREAKVLAQVGELLGLEQNKIKPFLPKGYKLG